MLGVLGEAAAALSRKKVFGDEERWRGGVLLTDERLRGAAELKAAVHPTTRVHVELGFGVSVAEQLAYELSVPLRMRNLDLREQLVTDAVDGDGTFLWQG